MGKNKSSIISSIVVIGLILAVPAAKYAHRKIKNKNEVSLLKRAPDDARYNYSLFDKSSWPTIEDPLLPSQLRTFKTIPGSTKGSYLSSSRSLNYKSWYRSHGDNFSSKYSSLNSINRKNVSKLTVAWVYHSGEGNWKGKPGNIDSETNPVMAEGRVFIIDPSGELVALSADGGHELWRQRFAGSAARRGLVWWPGNKKIGARIYIPAGDRLYALNPKDGSLIPSFGINGSVQLERVSLTAPAFIADRIVVTTMAPGVEAFQIEDGTFLWRRSLIAGIPGKTLFQKEFKSGANPWAGFSVDEARSAIFVTTGNPQHNFSGLARAGKNKHSNSVLSIDSKTGTINWEFQEISHDIWDLDIPAPPVLTAINVNGKMIDVVAAVTKIGNTLLLSRDTGHPIFDYRLRKTPTSTVPGETTERYQPSLLLPERFLKNEFKPNDITDIGEENHKFVEKIVKNADYGFFIPPEYGKNTLQYGIVGGAEWPGAAVDQLSGILYVPSEQIPVLYRIYYLDTTPKHRPPLELYQNKCASCHGNNREGQYHFLNESWAVQKKNIQTTEIAPALVAITAMREKKLLTDPSFFRAKHSEVNSLVKIGAQELETLYNYFSELDHYTDSKHGFVLGYNWWNLLDQQGYPGSKPPWGLLSAINLNTGKTLWKKPLGEYPELTKKGIPPTGQHNLGGVIVTRGGLVFATGTLDKKIRAIDSLNGNELWHYTLPGTGSAPPSTYEINGTQYIVVVSHGGRYPNFDDHSDTVIAFKINN